MIDNENNVRPEQSFDRLRTLLEWDPGEPPSTLRLIKIIDCDLSSIQKELEEKGYSILTFDDPENKDSLEKLQTILINAQGIYEGRFQQEKFPSGKIVICLSKQVYEKIIKDQTAFTHWGCSRGYSTTIGTY